MEAMLRPFLIATVISPVLLAQTAGQRLEEAWAHYLTFDILGGTEQRPQAGLGDALDELGRAWANWVEWHGRSDASLPGSMNFQRSDEPDTLTPPISRIISRRGPWVLMGLEVPAPCGSHRFLALFKEGSGRWKLALLDLHEARSDRDPLGAREKVQALLLDGPRIAVASTPPWCTSCWSVLHARIESPGSKIEEPKVLVQFEDSLYRCADQEIIRMTPLQGGIRLRYEGMGPDGSTSPRDKTLRIP